MKSDENSSKELSKSFSSIKPPKDTDNSESPKKSDSLKNQLGDAANQWLEKNRSLTLRQTPIWAQSITFLLILLGSVSVIASIFLRIDEVITAEGQLKSIGGTVDVKSPVGGSISQIHFKDGEVVEKGQLLATFDTRQAFEDKKTYTSLIQIEQDQLKTRLNSYQSQKNSLSSQTEVYKQRLATKSLIVSEMKKLVDIGGFQRIQYLQNKDQILEIQEQINEIEERINRINLEIENTRLQSLKSLDQMRNSLKRADLQLQYQNIIAPLSGVIFNPKVSVSSVVTAGESMLSIVSQSGLFAEVFVPNKDIGYISKGQDALVRVDAFPFSRYGEIKATVNQVSADALPPSQTKSYYNFPIKLKLSRDYLGNSVNPIPLKPGMSINANMRLRDKPVISLVSDIFVKQVDSVKSIRQQ